MKKEDYKKLGLKNGATDTSKYKNAPKYERFDDGIKNGGTIGIGKGIKKPRVLEKTILAIVIAAVLVVGLRIGVGPTILWADISAYENEQILVTGLTDEDFYITPGQLAELPLEKVTATGETAKAGTVNGIGPTMDTFIEAYGEGAAKEDFKQVKFYASDNYTTALVRTLQEGEIVLSIANGNEPLYEGHQPLRIVIPGEDSGTWIYMITAIEFTPKDSSE